jgi:CBS domain-containing protein
MLVEEVMTRNVVTIDCNKTVIDACEVYSKNKVGCLVVMDNNIIVGIVTERDTIERVILQNKDPKKTKVREIMSQNIKTIHALTPLEKAAQIMKENNIKKLPVVLNNEIVGIVTETDLSRTITAFTEAIDELIEFYADSKNNIEKIMDDWGDIIIKLKAYKKLTPYKKLDISKIEGMKTVGDTF